MQSYRQFIRFAIVGGVGFLVDGGLLTLLNSFFDLNVYGSRIISFPLATIATWYLNRTFSFRSGRIERKEARKEYLRYFLVQIGGGALNLAVFIVTIHFVLWMKIFPILPLAIGALMGLIFNYGLSRIWVFRETK